jgi:ADP-ribosyl-[dinitrogen reductase] hydrolase
MRDLLSAGEQRIAHAAEPFRHRRGRSWVSLLDEAERGEPSSFANNGWVVSALQAACSALIRTTNLRDALIAAVHAGNDTDTVAAITGALGGARYGGSAVPLAWLRRLHGWPGLRAGDLTRLAVLAVNNGKPAAPEA